MVLLFLFLFIFLHLIDRVLGTTSGALVVQLQVCRLLLDTLNTGSCQALPTKLLSPSLANRADRLWRCSSYGPHHGLNHIGIGLHWEKVVLVAFQNQACVLGQAKFLLDLLAMDGRDKSQTVVLM